MILNCFQLLSGLTECFSKINLGFDIYTDPDTGIWMEYDPADASIYIVFPCGLDMRQDRKVVEGFCRWDDCHAGEWGRGFTSVRFPLSKWTAATIRCARNNTLARVTGREPQYDLTTPPYEEGFFWGAK